MPEKIYWFQTKSTGQNFEIYWSDLSDLSHVWKFLWKLHGNFGCHGNRSWKITNDISYESFEPILLKFHFKHYVMVIQNWAKKVMIWYSRWTYGHMVKTFEQLLFQDQWANLADILPVAYGAPPYIK